MSQDYEDSIAKVRLKIADAKIIRGAHCCCGFMFLLSVFVFVFVFVFVSLSILFLSSARTCNLACWPRTCSLDLLKDCGERAS